MKLKKIKTKKDQAHWHEPFKKAKAHAFFLNERYVIYWVVCP